MSNSCVSITSSSSDGTVSTYASKCVVSAMSAEQDTGPRRYSTRSCEARGVAGRPMSRIKH
jgi:hypothetical protein